MRVEWLSHCSHAGYNWYPVASLACDLSLLIKGIGVSREWAGDSSGLWVPRVAFRRSLWGGGYFRSAKQRSRWSLW